MPELTEERVDDLLDELVRDGETFTLLASIGIDEQQAAYVDRLQASCTAR